MKHEQKIYYSIGGLTIFFGWLVASAIAINGQASIELNNPASKTFFLGFYNYLINWKLFSFICLIMGAKAALLLDNKDFSQIIIHSLSYAIIAIALAFANAATLSILPLAIFYPILFWYRNRSQLYIPITITLFVFLAVFFSLFTDSNNFLDVCFYELSTTQLTLNNFYQTFSILITPNQLFGFSYGISILFIGYWLGKTKWFNEYHFLYKELKHLFKLSLGLLILWTCLNYFNVYHYISQWKIGKVFFMLDGYIVQILTMYIYVFLLIYFENFKWGLTILRNLENTGKSWILQLISMVSFILFFRFLRGSINPIYVPCIAILLFYAMLKLNQLLQNSRSKKTINN
ncbi:MAG: hypothetical protein JEZ09_21455 [Salinivirgaceae bacterium]|nr:hypothetical protein [Salinivirgaceae bacterium]